MSATPGNVIAGDIVARSFSAGFVVLSYAISYIGAWTTLEIINKRTAGRGVYNWALLIGAAISMGGIAIWCMHFIGNRAVVLGSGAAVLQIAYNPGFTALSFFVPILVLLAAFLAVGSNDTVSTIRVGIGRTIAGLGICGMHYLGQAGISNYDCIYQAGNVVGAAIIACAASITALLAFFVLRSTWTNSWLKRALTAIVLAGGVSGMHWLASVGTRYRLRQAMPDDSSLSNNSTVIVVIVLSIAACFVLLGFTVLAHRRRSRSANRAQQVVLAAAIFDDEGRLMVTPEGLLPNSKITNTFVERSFDDIFSISHPVFLWLYRASRNWSSVVDILPAMRQHVHLAVHATGISMGSRHGDPVLTTDAGEPVEEYSVIFRELFCIAAADLAEQFNESLENAGILFDEILTTGTKLQYRVAKKTLPTTLDDPERGGVALPNVGRGQLLFLVRSASSRQVEHLQAAGFRFASVSNILDIVASSMQINVEDLTRCLALMRQYISRKHILEPGVHVGVFAVRASVTGGFDVLVRKDARNQLPTMLMPNDPLDNWQMDYLRTMDGWTMRSVLKHLEIRGSNPIVSRKEQLFATYLFNVVEALKLEIDEPLIHESLLVARPVSVPCRGPGESSRPGSAILIAFRTIVPIHGRVSSKKLEFCPLSFFKTQQHVYPHSQDHDVFKRVVHKEFAPILGHPKLRNPEILGSSSVRVHRGLHLFIRRDDKPVDMGSLTPGRLSVDCPPQRSRSPMLFWRSRQASHDEEQNTTVEEQETNLRNGDSSSEKHLVHTTSAPLAYGGIMVSQEVTVDVREFGRTSPSGHAETDDRHDMLQHAEAAHGHGENMAGRDIELLEMRRREPGRMGTRGMVSADLDDMPTFVDRLFAVCVEAR